MKKVCFLISVLIIFFSASTQAFSRTLTVLYTGQTHSALFPCHCPAEPAGGIARRAAKIKELKKAEGPMILIEAGDSLASGERDAYKQDEQTDKLRTKVYLSALKSMGYDAIAFGRDADRFGTDFLLGLKKETKAPVIAAGIAGFPIYEIKEVNGIKVALIASGGFSDQDIEEKLKVLIGSLKRKGTDLVFLLDDHSIEFIKQLLGKVRGIDCVFSTDVSLGFGKAFRSDSTIIASPFWQARRLSRLDLDVEDNRLKDFKYSEIKLTPDVEPDAAIEKTLRGYPEFKR